MSQLNLRILLPSKVFLDTRVTKITAEAENGSFCIMPKHIDFVTSLAPGILFYFQDNNSKTEHFVAVDQGILVKREDEVLVSTRRAVAGAELGELEQTIVKEFSILDEKEKKARSASFKLEADLVRRYMELKEHD